MKTLIVLSALLAGFAQADDCGVPAIKPSYFAKYIVGGKPAIPYSWPWQVVLTKKINNRYAFTCGGSVIANQWVITAGHCLYDDQDPSHYQVKLGVYNQTDNAEPGEIVSDIAEVHVNPQYKPVKTDYDITLLKLVTAVPFSNHISPICLPNQGQDLPPVGTEVIVTGWGSISEDGHVSDVLREVQVPLMNQSTCDTDYGSRKIDNTNMFCAGLPQGGKDSCQGDSGGPVTFFDTNTNKFIEVGLVSWGDGCAEAGKPGVYSRMSSYIDWISTYVTPPHA